MRRCPGHSTQGVTAGPDSEAGYLFQEQAGWGANIRPELRAGGVCKTQTGETSFRIFTVSIQMPHVIFAVPPLSFPPLTKPVEFPQDGQVRPLRFRWPLTKNTLEQTGHVNAALLPNQSSEVPSCFGFRERSIASV